MTAEIIQIDDYMPHYCGEAKYVKCKHKWLAIWPVDALELECPECGEFSIQEEPMESET